MFGAVSVPSRMAGSPASRANACARDVSSPPAAAESLMVERLCAPPIQRLRARNWNVAISSWALNASRVANMVVVSTPLRTAAVIVSAMVNSLFRRADEDWGSHALQADASQRDGVRDAECVAGVGGDTAQEPVGVEVAAEAVEVGAVGAQRRDAGGQVVGDVDAVLGPLGAHQVDLSGAGPGVEAVVEQFGEDPAVGGVAGGVEHGVPDGAVVGLVEKPLTVAHPDGRRGGCGEQDLRAGAAA